TPRLLPVSLHDALPICPSTSRASGAAPPRAAALRAPKRRSSAPVYGGREPTSGSPPAAESAGPSAERGSRSSASGGGCSRSAGRSEEHTSELQSRENLV